MGPYSARDLAGHIVRLRKLKKDTVTPLQLMKLVYLCHGWMLGKFGRPLVSDTFDAWRHGPVAPDLYQATKKFGGGTVDGVDGANVITLDAEEADLVNTVTDFYAPYDGLRLSALTHAPGSPWDTIWKLGITNASIPNDVIENYYSSLAKKNN